ncbi:MAG: hypothetical protein QM817_18505 [Archangium sp.]
MSRKLLVVPDVDRVEQWLLDESRRAEFVDLRDTWTVSELLERLEPGAWARRAPADPLLVQMLFGKLAGEYAASAYGPAAHTAEFAAQARELISQLRGQGATARALEEAAGKLEGSAADRARSLAELWRAVDAALLKMGLVDRGDWLSLAASRVNEWGLPAAFEVFEAIEIRYVHDVTPARLALFEALARAASSAGVQFAWRYPASGAVSCDAFIIEAVRAAEAKWQAVEVDLAPDVPEGPLAWVAPALFGEGAAGAAPELTGFCAPTHRDEVREIARRVRRLVSAGVPPEAICIAWRELAEDTEQLVEALHEVGVPVRARLGVPLTQSPNGRLALSLLELADEGFPADAVASLLESRAVKVLPDDAADPRAAFREAGVRDDSDRSCARTRCLRRSPELPLPAKRGGGRGEGPNRSPESDGGSAVGLVPQHSRARSSARVARVLVGRGNEVGPARRSGAPSAAPVIGAVARRVGPSVRERTSRGRVAVGAPVFTARRAEHLRSRERLHDSPRIHALGPQRGRRTQPRCPRSARRSGVAARRSRTRRPLVRAALSRRPDRRPLPRPARSDAVVVRRGAPAPQLGGAEVALSRLRR